MPAPAADLVRGAVCLALYPFTTGFPLEVVLREHESEVSAQLERFENIEDVVALLRPPADAPDVVTRLKLRRVLVLQDGTDPRRQDISVLRINSVPPATAENHRAYWRQLVEGAHPTRLLLRPAAATGITKDATVDCLAINTIAKASILKRVGRLSEDDLRAISERLVTALELDISSAVEARAQQLREP